MKVVAFIEPPQARVIEKILRNCGLWQEPNSRDLPDIDGLVEVLDSYFVGRQVGSPESDQAQELTYVDTNLRLTHQQVRFLFGGVVFQNYAKRSPVKSSKSNTIWKESLTQ